MAKSKRLSREGSILNSLKQHVQELEALIPSLSKHAALSARKTIDDIRLRLTRTSGSLDPIKEPSSLFDPTNPDTAGRLVALALLAQPRIPLDHIARAYGAGVYAVYYRGSHPYYLPISNSETPIYVGKADPKSSQARTAREQGERLYGRLRDHRKVIRAAENYARANNEPYPLHINDFECRQLVTATNAQLVAERHLINLFTPVWNSDTKVCWGISKHGDKEGRSNDRSPWFVVHPTEYWTIQTKLKDARPKQRIIDDIARHFSERPIFATRAEIIERFLVTFAQHPAVTATPVQDDENDAIEKEDAS